MAIAASRGRPTVAHDPLAMQPLPVHQPPPDPVVAALVQAGVSRDTALAMERWKAEEVLDLLRVAAAMVEPSLLGETLRARGTI